MKRNYLIISLILTLLATLAVLLSGCSGNKDELEGKNIVTFEINGGILNYGTSSTDESVNYAYHPGTYIKDPTTFPNYSISRKDYVFTGWYTSKDCTPDSKWDFSKPFDTPTLTLYAGWEVALKFTFSVNYVNGSETVTLGTNTVKAGERFEDWRNYANERSGYTAIGYYSDPECTTPWDFATTHPGGNADLDIPVYVKHIEGEWKIVDSFEKLKSALKSGNVYLMNDIDCGGAELYVSGTFNKIFEGNGYKVTNFTVNKKGTSYTPTLAIFQALGDRADVKNVTFENATYKFFDILNAPNVKVQVASLAVGMQEGAKVTNVSISGKLETNYENEFPCLNEVFYYTGDGADAPLSGVTDFTADITVEE